MIYFPQTYKFLIVKSNFKLSVFVLLMLSFGFKVSAQLDASWNYTTRTGSIGTDYSWIDCSGGIPIVSGDDAEGSFSWPFTFKYYDNIYTTANNLSVSSNGFVRLDGTASTNGFTAKGYNLTSTGTGLGQIIGLAVFDNKIGDNGGYCKYLVTGSYPTQILTVEYFNLEIDFNDSRYASVQVSFYETSNKIVLKFATENIKRKGTDMGIHSGITGYFNKWGEVKGFSNNTWIEYLPFSSLTVSPTTLAFGYFVSGDTSEEQTFAVSGSDLNQPPGNITVNAPANFEVSLSSGTGFGSAVTIAYSEATLAATTIYVRFKPTSSDTDYNGDITISGGGSNSQIVTVSGTSVSPGYCTFNLSNVRPITYVEFSNAINVNRTINAPPRTSYEDYSATISPAMIFTGGSYDFTIEGYTGPVNQNETIYYTVFFDWNNDGDFTDSGEYFQIGTINGSTGNDGKQASAIINIPVSNIAFGNTRMRIIGDNQNYNTNPCSPVKNKSNGQLQDYTVQIAKPTFVWEGTTDSDWNKTTNWSDGVVPGVNDDVVIPATVSSGNWPTITTAVGSVKNLDIQSSASGTGSLIVNGGSIGVFGTINAERYVPSDDWHIISSPVSGQQLGSFATNNTLGFYDGAYDISPYVESAGDWAPFTVVAGTTTTFGRSVGYLSRLPVSDEPRNVSFEGTSLYSGAINQSITYSTTPTAHGWNCVGNPYLSTIKATGSGSFQEVNVATGNIHPDYTGIYTWNHSIWDYDVYSASIPLNLAMGQGFVIKSKTGGGTVQFTPSMQLHSNVNLKSTEIPWPYIKLNVYSSELENSTLINFNDEMTKGLDLMYDVGKLKGNPDIALYTKLLEGSDIDFAVQAIPLSTTESVSIPVGLDCSTGGEFEFNAEISGLPEGIDVILEDKKEKISTILSQGKIQYNTTVEPEAKGTGRFYLLLKSNTTDNNPEIDLNPFNVFTRSKIIFIDGPSNKRTTFSLYSIDGKMWSNQKAENFNRNKIDGTLFPPGIYLLKINHEGSQQTKKLVLMQ